MARGSPILQLALYILLGAKVDIPPCKEWSSDSDSITLLHPDIGVSILVASQKFHFVGLCNCRSVNEKFSVELTFVVIRFL